MSPVNRLPAWLRQDIPTEKVLDMSRQLCEYKVNTVCSKALCPNINHCFGNHKLTFMILGDTCTRNCTFCNVGTVLNLKQKCPPCGKVDVGEPQRISQAVKSLGLNYVVVTSVTRDDLADGGAAQFSRTIELIHSAARDINPVRDIDNSRSNSIVSNRVKVEVLIPDFCGKINSLKSVLKASPDIVAHNIETVERLYPYLRPQADYRISLELLNNIKILHPGIITKSSIMLGLGETKEEVVSAMRDLRQSQCDILTLGQYLAPSAAHYPVREFISIGAFLEYELIANGMGFKAVSSGPLVRSSYHAQEIFSEALYV